MGLLWQQSASMQAAHIWCPKSCTSMLHTSRLSFSTLSMAS
jgi:hypothetical protein